MGIAMNDKQVLLQHFLATLAYRTQKALRGAPDSFSSFTPGQQVRTPHALVRHMSGVLNYALKRLGAGEPLLETLPTFSAEVQRFHTILNELHDHLETDTLPPETTHERLLQGPFADAMTHAGQLAMLRRLAGTPVRPENFMVAAIETDHVGEAQPNPVSPDAEWPEAPLQDQEATW